MPRPRSNVPSGIRALERGIQVLFYLSEHGDELSIAQISSGLNLGGATVYRMLITLEGLGLVTQNPENSKYRLTTRIVEMGKRLLDSIDIRREARPIMTDLRDRTRETIGLYIRVGEQRSCIEQVESQLDVRRASALGRSFALLSGSSGKVLCAFMPDGERRALVQANDGAIIDGQQVTIDGLLAELDRVRDQGYSISTEQGILDMSGVSFPVRDANGTVVAALSVAGPASRWNTARIEDLLPDLQLAADRLSAAIGYPLSEPLVLRP